MGFCVCLLSVTHTLTVLAVSTGPHDEASMHALGRYVQTRRSMLPDSTIRWASHAAGISAKKWIDVEKGRGPHSKLTLRKVARALGESPRHIYVMAGIDYDEAEVAEELTAEPDRLGRLERQVAELIAELRSLRLPPQDQPPGVPGHLIRCSRRSASNSVTFASSRSMRSASVIEACSSNSVGPFAVSCAGGRPCWDTFALAIRPRKG